MQFSFEFDAPRHCFLETPLHRQEKSDYVVKNQDQNDFWFMQTCEKSDPLNTLDQNTKSQRKQTPVLRTRVIKEENSLLEITEDQQRIIKSKTNFQKEGEKQDQVLNIEQVEIQKEIRPKTSRITFRKTGFQKQKKKPNVKHSSADKQQKPALNKMPARSKSNLPKANFNDIRPCPFPPRIQRQWQNKFEKKWYRLSPTSKVQAQKQMKQIQAQKNKEKQNTVKDNPFLRKQILKKK